MTSLIGIQIALLIEIASAHGHEGDASLRWCVREGLVERVEGGFQVTATGRDAVHQRLLTTQKEKPVARERPQIVVARSISEAKAAAAI